MPHRMSEHQRLLNSSTRLRALQLSGLIDSPAEQGFDRVTGLMGRLLQVPVALVSLVDDGRQFFKSCHGTLAEPWHSLRETPLSHSFCQYVVTGNSPLIIEDARSHDLVKNNLAVPDLGVIAYLGFPLTDPEGNVFGSLCAIDGEARQWSSSEIETVREFAAVISDEIHLHLEILARRKSEESLLVARRIAEGENEGKTEFLANMSHELRTPLNAILGFTQLVKDELCGPISPKQARYLGHVYNSGQHLLDLINQLLDLSKINAGKWSVSLQPVDCFDCLSTVVESLEPLLTARGLSISQERPEQSWVLEADLIALKQVLYNLLSNAIKFTSEGEIVLKVEQFAEKSLFSVQDSGQGIALADLERVFVPFEQLDHSSAKVTDAGTGLGLSVTKKLVELHGGRIWAESKGSGHGATFFFEIPRTV